MAEITAGLVKELRQRTGAGMMECKTALIETDGDIEAAVDWLRKKGLAAAVKKSARAAADGLIGAVVEGGRGALVEVNAETDFVARNQRFQDFVGAVTRLALAAGGDLDRLRAMDYPGTGRTVDEEATHLVSTVGENILVRRTAALSSEAGLLATYVHNRSAPGLGKIGVLLALESEAEGDRLATLGKHMAMHVAAASPQYLSVADIDPAALSRERDVLAEQARASGRPEEIVAKMVEGRLRKYYEDVVLLEQSYVIEGESKVAQAVDAAAKELGVAVRVAGFVRFALGEGVAKAADDFAAEVAKLTG